MIDTVNKAIDILKQGGIVIFPTDTAFGIGCVIDDVKAVARLFEIRKRPVTQATPVLVDTVKMAQEYVQPIPKEVVDGLIEPYWPGALTIILYRNKVKIPELVSGGTNTLGVRIPNHPVTRAIIQGVDKPILGPSANFHGEKTPYRFEELDKRLVEKVDYVAEGRTTSNVASQVSTVIDCTVSPWKVLRQGAVSIQYQVVSSKGGKVILYIDTSSNEKITVSLKINGEEDAMTRRIDKQKAQVVLPFLDTLLKKHHLEVPDIDEIHLNEGPGSFTGLRVGAAIANALGFSLNIPINGKNSGIFVNPRYF